MAETILILTAVCVLVVAGLILAVGMKKNRTAESVAKKQDLIKFETKYDEVSYLYKTGFISEDEYKEQIKNIIN